MGITNFVGYEEDTNPVCRYPFSVSKNMRIGAIEI